MGLLSFLGLQKRSDTVSNAQLLHLLTGGNQTASGHAVTVDNSFGIPTLWAGYRFLGNAIASLPLEIFERKKGGDFPATDLPLYHILGSQPSDLLNSFSFKETMQINLESYGNAYARIHKSKGEISEFEWMHPDRVTVLYNTEKRLKKYKVKYGQKDVILDHDQVIHLMTMSKDGIIGQSVINACREALGMMLAAQEYGAKYFANGAQTSGLLSSPNNLTPDQVKQIRNFWMENYQGSKNAGQVAVLHSGATYQQISAKPADADFINTMKWTGEQICQMLGVPPHLLGILERSTNNNIEQQSIDNVVHCIRPRVKCWETELNTKLWLTPDNRKRYYARFNLDSLLRGDTATRGEFYSKMFNIGVLSPNDIRRQEHLNDRPGGDEYFVQVNMGGNQTISEPKPQPNVKK